MWQEIKVQQKKDSISSLLKKKTKKTQLKKKNFLVHSGNEQLSCHMLCLKKEFN